MKISRLMLLLAMGLMPMLAFAETPAHLLINHPRLAEKPGARGAATDWLAGSEITLLGEPCMAPVEPGSTERTTWTQVRAMDASKTGWLPAAFVSAYLKRLDEANREAVDRRHGLDPDAAPPDLVSIRHGYESDKPYQLRREAAAALEELIAAARADGIALVVVSAYRSWERQQQLYQAKIEKAGPNQNTVAPPGHSEHQLGTAVDFGVGTPQKTEETLLKESFGATPAGEWLATNAPHFGFAVSYTRHNRPQTGYAPEPWHYRFWGRQQAPARHGAALGH